MDPKLPIRRIDYTVIFARQMAAMREFYGETLGFPFAQAAEPPVGVLSMQLAFRVERDEVDSCAAVLVERGVRIVEGPTDQPFGHRTLFFRDPDGNVLEIYAEI